MKIREISLENFRSFSSIQVQLPQIPILVIYDSNGSGKTTLLEGIIFGVKGEIEAYKSSEYGSIDALYNLRETRNKRIISSILLEDKEGSVLIEANRPKRKRTYLTKSNKFDIKFKVNEENKSLQEFQEICDNYLGIDYNMFPLANFLSQNVINDVLVSDAKVRGEVFSKLLSTDWINSIIDYISSNITNIRKRKKVLESKWENLNLILKNTQLDSLYQQIMENVKLLINKGITLQENSKVNPIDINSRIKTIAEILSINEITEYLSTNDIDNALGKTRREKFVKKIYKSINDLKVSSSVKEKSVENMSTVISEIKDNIKQKSLSEKLLIRIKNDINKIEVNINKISDIKQNINAKIIDVNEELDIVTRKNKEIKKIEGDINRIDKKYGNIEKIQLLKIELTDNIDEKSDEIVNIEKIIPIINNTERKITRNKKEYTILEENIERLELEYSAAELVEKCNYIEKELKEIEIVEKIDTADLKLYNQLIMNEADEETIKNIIQGIKNEVNKIDYRSRIFELEKFIVSKENNKNKEIDSITENIAEIKDKLTKDTEIRNELLDKKDTVDKNIDKQLSISDKSKLNYFIIAISLAISLAGIFGIKFLLLFLFPGIIFLGLQYNIISPTPLYGFIPLKYRLAQFEKDQSEIMNKIEIVDERIIHIEDKLRFYSDQLTELNKMKYSPPAWINQIDPELMIKEYSKFEKISSELKVFDKLLYRMIKYNSIITKMKKIDNDNKELITSINDLEFSKDNKIKVSDYKGLVSLMNRLNERRDKLKIEIRDTKLRIEEIDNLISSRIEFEKTLEESLIHNENKITKTELLQLEKTLKSKLKALNGDLKKIDKDLKDNSKKLIDLNSEKGNHEGNIKAADKSVSRVLKELGLSDLPENIDEEMEKLFVNSKKEVENTKNKMDRIILIEKEIEELHDHLKKWDLIQSNWKKHQSLVNSTQIKIREIEQMANKLNQMELSLKIINKAVSEENELYLKKLENNIINDLNRYFDSLGGHDEIGELNFNFKVSRNKMNAQLSVGYRNTTGAPRALYSNGQQVSLVIALFMATTKVNNLNSKFKWIGFDEPTQFLDTERKINFIETLKLFYNDLNEPQIIISTADSEFIDLIKNENGIQVFSMSELVNYRIGIEEKPRVNLVDGKFSLNKRIDIPKLEAADLINFDDELPTKAKKAKSEFKGIEITCEICGKNVMVATYTKVCGDKECIAARSRSFFS